MPYQFQSGTANNIPDWFSKFETFITSVGWSITLGSGTTTIVLGSSGEAGNRTKLFARLRRDGTNLNRVYGRVQDNGTAAPAHSTTDPDNSYVKWLDAGGAGDIPFAYWIGADKDMIVICFKAGASYTGYYIGVVEPFAVTIPGEEYQYVIVGFHVYDQIFSGRVLRLYTGTWDQTIRAAGGFTSYYKDPLDDSCALIGEYVYYNTNNNIIGQLMNVSKRIQSLPSVNPEDVINTGQPGATSTWVIMGTGALRWAIRTGGEIPLGSEDGVHLTFDNGLANTLQDLEDKIDIFLAGIGWSVSDYIPPAYAYDKRFNSAGENGLEDIWIRFRYKEDEARIEGYMMDSGSDNYHTAYVSIPNLLGADFPTYYWLVGDRDCFCLVVENEGIMDTIWFGILKMFNPNPDTIATPYKAACLSSAGTYWLLRRHDGAWSTSLGELGTNWSNSSPNVYDGVSCVVWPFPFTHNPPPAAYVPTGVPKYLHRMSGTNISLYDRVQIGAKVFTSFYTNFAVRTA